MLRRFLLTGMITVLFASAAAADGMFELALDNNSLDARGGVLLGSDDDSGFLLAGRYLYTDDEETSLPAAIAAFASRASANPEVEFSLGLQGYFGETGDDIKVRGIAVGGSVEWAPTSFHGAFVGARLWYVPDVLGFDHTDSVTEWAARGGYRINKKLQVFVQYSDVEVDDDDFGSFDALEEFQFGFGGRF